MSVPTLQLGISAPGAQSIIDLAAAVNSLKNNLATLAGAAASPVAGLDKVTSEVAKIRKGLGEAVAGIRTDITGLKQAITDQYEATAKATKEGAEKVAKAASEGKAKIRYSMSVDQGGGLKSNVTGTSADAVRKLAAEEAAQTAGALAAAAEKINAAKLSYRFKLMVGSAKIAEGVAKDEAREADAKLSYRIKLMTGSAKIAETVEKAAAQEESSRLSYRIKLMTGSAKIADTVQRAAEQEAAAKLAFRIKMMTGSAQIVAAAHKEAADILAAQRIKDAAWAVADAKAKLRMQRGARALLDRGMGIDDVSARLGVNAATAAMSGPGVAALTAQIDALSVKAKGAAIPMNNLSKEMRDAHSAARGLASGFGAMWLTWGNLVPLLAGAAVSNAFVQTIKKGAEFEQTILSIGHIAGQSGEEIKALTQASLDLAVSGPYGPNEVAKAVKALALAGLNAKEQIEALKPTLDFAMVGEMPLEKSAETLVAVATAFGFAARDYSVVSDIVAKTAAVSMASVEGMASSFKNASAIAQVYKVSIDDVALSLALMAQVGIKNQEAGTAVRAMYTQLATGGRQAKKILQEVLNVSAVDNVTKAMRPLSDILMDMMKSLSKMTFAAQIEALQKMSAQRGMKSLAADLTAFITAAQASGQSADVLKTKFTEMQEAIAEAPGFAAMAAIGMTTTTLNNMKMVSTALETSLVNAFKAVNSEVLTTSQLLQRVFQSKEFQDGLQSLISGTASVVKWLMDNVALLKAVAIGYGVGKLAVVAYTAATAALTVAQGFFAASSVTAAAGATAVGVAATGAAAGTSLLMASLGPIAILAAAAGAAWIMFGTKAENSLVDVIAAQAKAEAATRSYSTTALGGMDKEIERLEKIAKERENKATMEQINAKIEADLVRDTLEQRHAEERAVLELARSYRQMAADKFAALDYSKTKAGEAELARLNAEVNNATLAIQAAFTRQDRTMSEYYAKRARLFELSKAQAAAAKKEIDERNRQRPTGPNGLDLSNGKDGAGGRNTYDNELTQLKLQQEKRLQLLDTQQSNEARLLEAHHRAKLLTDGAYAAQLAAQQESQEAAKRKQLADDREEFRAAWIARDEELVRLGGKNVEQARENLINVWDTYIENQNTVLGKMDSNAFMRQALGVIKLRGELKELSDSTAAYLLEQESGLRVAAAEEEARFKLADASEEVRARAEAEAKMGAVLAAQIAKLSVAYKLAAADAALFTDNADLQAKVKAYKEAIEKIQAAAPGLQQLAGDTAVTGVRNKELEQLRKDATGVAKEFSSTLADAVLEGGKDGSKKFKDWLKDYFKKPFKIILEAAFRPLGNMFAQAMYPGAGQLAGTTSGPGASFGSMMGMYNTASGLGSIGTAFMGGYTGAAAAGSAFAAGGAASSAFGVGAGATGALEMATIGGGTAAAAGGGGIMAGMGAALSAIPVAGWIALGAMVLTSFMKDRGGPKADGVFGAELNSGIGKYDNSLVGGVEPAVQGLQSSFDALMKQFEADGAGIKFGMGISRDPEGDAPTFLDVVARGGAGELLYNSENRNVGRSDAELEAAVKDAATNALFATLASIDLGEPFDAYFDSIAQDATAAAKQTAITTATNAKAIYTAFDLLGPAFSYVADMTVEATAKLVEAGGGLEHLSANLASYYDNFFSDDEKKLNVAEQISVKLAKSDVTLSPEDILGMDRNEFRAMVEQYARLGAAGEEAYLALLSVNGAFASITPTAQEAADALKEVADALEESTRNAFQTIAAALKEMHDRVNAADEAVLNSRTAISNAYNKAKQTEESAHQRYLDLLRQQDEAVASFAKSVEDFLGTLKTGPNSVLSPAAQYLTTKRDFYAGVDAAADGDPAARENLTNLAGTFLASAKANARTSLDYAKDQIRVQTTLQNLLASLPAPQTDPKATLEEQIAEAYEEWQSAQVDTANYLALAVETGTDTNLGVWTVASEITELRNAYNEARNEQIAANATLDIALAALNTLGLSEGVVNVLANWKESDFAVALNVSDDVIADLQAALGLTDDELADLEDVLNIEVQQSVLDALAAAMTPGTGVLDTLGVALGPKEGLLLDLQNSLGISSLELLDLQNALMLSTEELGVLNAALGVEQAQRDEWAAALGVNQTDLTPLATILNYDATILTPLNTALGITQEVRDKLIEMKTAIDFSDAAIAIKEELASKVDFSDDAMDTYEGLLKQAGFSDEATTIYNELATKLGFSAAADTTIGGLGTAVGLQNGLRESLQSALGLSSSAQNTINNLLGVLNTQTSNSATVTQAYASIGRVGFGTNVNQIDAGGYQYWLNQLNSGAVSAGNFQSVFLNDAAQWVTAKPDDPLSAYVKPYLHDLGVAGFDTGLTRASSDMIVKIHEDESIVPAAYNPAAGGSDPIVAELRAVRSQLADSNRRLAVMQEELKAVKTSSARTADILRNVTPSGNSLQMETAA